MLRQKQIEQKIEIQQNQPQEQTLTKEEILKSLSAPSASGSPAPTQKEKEAILQSLSAPAETKTTVTGAQKQEILDSLSAPAPK